MAWRFIRRAAGAILVAFALTPSVSLALDLHVDAARGDDSADGLTWTSARRTITSALASALASPETDVISVAAGRYAGQNIVSAGVALLGGFPTGGGVRDPTLNAAILDGAGVSRPVVWFPPGADGTSLEGFVVMGGFEWNDHRGGGVLIEDAAPLIRDNVIQDNTACHGAGLAAIYTSPRPTARILGNLILRNGEGFVITRYECEFGVRSTCGGVDIVGPPGVDLGPVLSDNLYLDNHSYQFGDACLEGTGQVANEVMDRNSLGLYLAGDPVSAFNIAVTRSSGAGMILECGGNYTLNNVTLADNGVGLTARNGGTPTAQLENAILWGNGTEVDWRCSGAPSVTSSIVRGGFVGSGNFDADPEFVAGPEGDYYLSQVSAGQAVNSPAVDAGSGLASSVGLDQRTTASDSAGDTAMLDLGYHAARVTLTIYRGTMSDALAPYRTVSSLPFVDDPGTLTDPALPLLFYRIPTARSVLRVDENRATAAVRLRFLGGP